MMGTDRIKLRLPKIFNRDYKREAYRPCLNPGAPQRQGTGSSREGFLEKWDLRIMR